MSLYNKIFIVTFMGLSFIGLSAKEYPVSTGNKNILCTFQTMPQTQLHMIYNYVSSQMTVQTEKDYSFLNSSDGKMKNQTKKLDSFINTIKKRREQLGLSQSALARLIGLAEPNLSRLEVGKRQSWPKVRRDLAKALGCQESDLFPGGGGNDAG